MNTYLFMMQAQGIMIRENMRTIGAQVYEQVVRSAYAKRNSSVNDSGTSSITVILFKVPFSLKIKWKALIYAGKCRMEALINCLRLLFLYVKYI